MLTKTKPVENVFARNVVVVAGTLTRTKVARNSRDINEYSVIIYKMLTVKLE